MLKSYNVKTSKKICIQSNERNELYLVPVPETMSLSCKTTDDIRKTGRLSFNFCRSYRYKMCVTVVRGWSKNFFFWYFVFIINSDWLLSYEILTNVEFYFCEKFMCIDYGIRTKFVFISFRSQIYSRQY